MKKFILLLSVLFMVFCNSALAQQNTMQHETAVTLNTENLGNLPVLHEGRLKPLSSFAQIMLQKISGQSTLKTPAGSMDAIDWLTITLFDPQNAAEIPLFKIDNDAVRKKMGLDENTGPLSLSALQPGLNQTQQDVLSALQTPEKNRDNFANALIDAHEKAAIFIELMRSFSGLLPLDVDLPPAYKNELQGDINFLELIKIEPALRAAVENIVAQKGQNPSQYTPQELAIAKAGFQIAALRAGGQNNNLLRVIPVNGDEDHEWRSPWATILSDDDSPANAFLLSQWVELARAYREQDAELWNGVLTDLKAEIELQSAQDLNTTRFKIEQLYRGATPYFYIMLAYGLALACAAFAIAAPKKAYAPLAHKAATILAITGIALHTSAICARTYILERPPVGTLYESILFVSLIIAVIGGFAGFKKTNPLLLPGALLSAIGLLLLAPAFASPGENLEVLSAVLNTNFWLTTHVLCITAGYAVCILTAMLAHAGLFVKGFKNNAALWLKLQQSTYRFSMIALLLTAVGTVLGGIWADQSWGRFWGWDPKENGALLIVLWLIWVQHGRLTGRIISTEFMALTAALNIIVALSWFGVNLLNVGLHSYGFTTGIATGLFTFCALELALILALYFKTKRSTA